MSGKYKESYLILHNEPQGTHDSWYRTFPSKRICSKSAVGPSLCAEEDVSKVTLLISTVALILKVPAKEKEGKLFAVETCLCKSRPVLIYAMLVFFFFPSHHSEIKSFLYVPHSMILHRKSVVRCLRIFLGLKWGECLLYSGGSKFVLLHSYKKPGMDQQIHTYPETLASQS